MKKADEVKPQLTMSFDARDVVDVLVSEQEQHIENQVEILKGQVKEIKNEIKCNDEEIEKYTKEFVTNKFSDKISSITATLKDVGANATVRFEIIDGNDLPRRKRVVLTSNPEYEDKANKIIVALIICNKEFDRNTVDNTVSFFLESEYDEKLKEMNSKNEDLHTRSQKLKDQIDEFEDVLTKTDRLVRKAKASITKKAMPEDVNGFLTDFKQTYLKDTDLKRIEAK